MKLNISVSPKQLTEEQPSRCRLSLLTSHAPAPNLLHRARRFLSTLSSYHHSRLEPGFCGAQHPGPAGARGGDAGDIEMFLHRQSNIWWRRHCWTALRSSETPAAGLRINTDTNCCHWWSLGGMTSWWMFRNIMYSTVLIISLLFWY